MPVRNTDPRHLRLADLWRRELIGTSQVLFGSGFPHAEGLAEPTSFVNDLDGFSETEVRQVMRDNGLGLVASH